VPFFTNLESVFDALKIPCQDYDWYLSDLDTNHYLRASLLKTGG
jgi:hypothetical protein